MGNTRSPGVNPGRFLFALVWRCAVVVVVAGAVGLGVNAARTDGLPLLLRGVPCAGLPVAWWDKLHGQTLPATPYAFWKQRGVFLDGRPHSDYIFNHLPGAYTLPSDEFTEAWAAIGGLKKDGIVVFYGSADPCDTALRVAKRLAFEYGYEVYLLPGGYPAWEKAGYPLQGGHARGEPGVAP
jgi:rhodanese-related sulfurtransferase